MRLLCWVYSDEVLRGEDYNLTPWWSVTSWILLCVLSNYSANLFKVVWRVNNAIRWINLCPVDSVVRFVYTYSVSNLSVGSSYRPLEKLATGIWFLSFVNPSFVRKSRYLLKFEICFGIDNGVILVVCRTFVTGIPWIWPAYLRGLCISVLEDGTGKSGGLRLDCSYGDSDCFLYVQDKGKKLSIWRLLSKICHLSWYIYVSSWSFHSNIMCITTCGGLVSTRFSFGWAVC